MANQPRLPIDDTDDEELTFETLLPRLEEYIDCQALDAEVFQFYGNMQRSNILFPVQTAYIAAAYQVAIQEAYRFRRQHQREQWFKDKRYSSNVKVWVLECQLVDVKEQLPELDAAGTSPSLAVRISIEGSVKLTQRSSPARNFDGSFEPLKIHQDFDLHAKLPTSMLHLDLLHIDDDLPVDNPARETLIGHLRIPLRVLESQKQVRETYPLLHNGALVAQLKLRFVYTYKEEQMPVWDAAAGGIPRPPQQGSADFVVSVIGAGQIGSRLLGCLLRCGVFRPGQIKVSTRSPQKLKDYAARGVLCVYDAAQVAALADVLVIACLPRQLLQVVKEVRQSLRPTTLVVSMVGGYSASSIASLLRIAPEQVLRPSVGTESGLPLPEAASWPVFVPPQKQETLIGNRTRAKPVSRADVAIAKRAFQDQKSQREMRCHVLTAYRALLPDAEALRVCMQGVVSGLKHVVLCNDTPIPLQTLREIARASLTGVVAEPLLWGEHVPLPPLPPGSHVLVLPSGHEMVARQGTVDAAPSDDRLEYVLSIDGTSQRIKRHRLLAVDAPGGDDLRDRALSQAASPLGGHSVPSALEGFVLDAAAAPLTSFSLGSTLPAPPAGMEDGDLEDPALLAAVQDFFRRIGEEALGARAPPDAVMEEKGADLSRDKDGWTSSDAAGRQ